MAVKQTAGRDALGEFAPKFAELMTTYSSGRYGAGRSSWPCGIAAL